MQSSPDDLTLLYITAGELPDKWIEYQKSFLTGYKMITASRKPGSAIYDVFPKSYENIYRQMYFAACMAATPYVAMVEDDVLYCPEHFDYRPPANTFAYNRHRWSLFTWDEPIYHIRNRISNCSLIAPRILLIEALRERFVKWPNGWPPEFAGELGRERIERGLGVTLHKSIEYYSDIGIVHMNHDNASEDRQRRHRKVLGEVKAYDIPYWGRASDIVHIWRDKCE